MNKLFPADSPSVGGNEPVFTARPARVLANVLACVDLAAIWAAVSFGWNAADWLSQARNGGGFFFFFSILPISGEYVY